MRRRLLLAIGLLLAATTACAQSPDMVDKLNKAFEKNKLKPWTPQAIGEIPTPGAIQTPGALQIPKGIQAITVRDEKCEKRLSVAADVLFAFDQSTLTPDAEETLVVLGPKIQEAGVHPIVIEGHTDSIGADQYNQALSERRATTVKDWLVARQIVPAAAGTKGYGESRPVAPNTKPDGSDDPAGRQRNRRVEVVIDTCS
jgi:outer membrane protein OmpA-like peptidoglycan-associated protein